MSAGLTLYRSLVPAHAAVADPVVETWLTLAAQRHTAAVWGAVYATAMVWWAAHRIERMPGLVSGSGGAGEVGPITSQTDGDLSRSYGSAGDAGAATDPTTAELQTTRYGQFYLDLRGSRAGTAPTVVSP